MVYILDIIYSVNALFMFLLCFIIWETLMRCFKAVATLDSKLQNHKYKITMRLSRLSRHCNDIGNNIKKIIFILEVSNAKLSCCGRFSYIFSLYFSEEIEKCLK